MQNEDMVQPQLQRLVDVLAERLGRSVVLDDPEVDLLAASRHYGDADDQRVRAVLQRDVGGAAIGYILGHGVTRWTEPGFIPARADLGMKSRLCHAIRWQGELLGLLVVIDEHRSMTGREIGEVVRTGHEIGALLFGEQLGKDHRRHQRESAVADLVSTDPAAREAAVRALDGLGVVRRTAYATVTGLESDDHRGSLEASQVALALRIAAAAVARSRPGYATGATVGARGILVQVWDRPPTAQRLRAQATDLRDVAGRILGDGREPTAGVSRVHAGLEEAHRAFDEALIALRAARTVTRFGGLALADELGPLDIVLRVPAVELTAALVPQELLRLREGDRQGRLLETLRAYLDHAGSSPATAEALHIHRTSLYYRLERIEQLTGLSLSNGQHRLMLHLGLHVLDVVD